MNILACPRCGEHKLEFMDSYCFCWECGFSPDSEPDPAPALGSVHSLVVKAPDSSAREQVLERAS
jgi:hypothetical protein